MKQLQIMLKPVSARCNLRCGYCFYADVSDHRSSPAPAKALPGVRVGFTPSRPTACF